MSFDIRIQNFSLIIKGNITRLEIKDNIPVQQAKIYIPGLKIFGKCNIN